MNLTKLTILTGALAASLLTLPVSAQNPAPPANGQPGGDRGDRGGRGNFNPEEFRQRMAERLKTSLKVSDEEWGIIQPLIEKVTTKQRDAMSGRFGGRDRRGGPGGDRGGDSNTPVSPASAASQALRTTLENESATPEEIKAKLAAVRDTRKKAQGELETAREDLRKVLTVRQEAALVSMGILE